MKKRFSTFLLVAGVAVAGMVFSSCGKDDDNNNNNTPLATKEITLYNQSSGTALNAGTVTFAKLADGNASATINLAMGYRVNGVSMPASITNTVGGNELIYANLGNVDGSTGTGVTSPIVGASMLAIKYDTLITRTGFAIKVLNGSNVQAKGTL